MKLLWNVRNRILTLVTSSRDNFNWNVRLYVFESISKPLIVYISINFRTKLKQWTNNRGCFIIEAIDACQNDIHIYCHIKEMKFFFQVCAAYRHSITWHHFKQNVIAFICAMQLTKAKILLFWLSSPPEMELLIIIINYYYHSFLRMELSSDIYYWVNSF